MVDRHPASEIANKLRAKFAAVTTVCARQMRQFVQEGVLCRCDVGHEQTPFVGYCCGFERGSQSCHVQGGGVEVFGPAQLFEPRPGFAEREFARWHRRLEGRLRLVGQRCLNG